MKKIRQILRSFFGFQPGPVVTVYNGFGNNNTILVFGHVWNRYPRPRKTYRQNWLVNFFSVIRLFMAVPKPNCKIILHWQGQDYSAVTDADGFFKFEWNAPMPPEPGWHPVRVEAISSSSLPIQGYGRVFIPQKTNVAYVSDVDDTFLISHTSSIRKRLWVLLTRNERTRRAFDGVINHYQLLSESGSLDAQSKNPFFYVSSSEWNLYSFIREFIAFNKLPEGVCLLGKAKRLRDFWKSGQNNHQTKFTRIARILETYPMQKFVLLGDDSQQDPQIYQALVTHFPDVVLAVYLRKINPKKQGSTAEVVEEITSLGVACCYYTHSAEAVAHSKEIGLILS